MFTSNRAAYVRSTAHLVQILLSSKLSISRLPSSKERISSKKKDSPLQHASKSFLLETDSHLTSNPFTALFPASSSNLDHKVYVYIYPGMDRHHSRTATPKPSYTPIYTDIHWIYLGSFTRHQRQHRGFPWTWLARNAWFTRAKIRREYSAVTSRTIGRHRKPRGNVARRLRSVSPAALLTLTWPRVKERQTDSVDRECVRERERE